MKNLLDLLLNLFVSIAVAVIITFIGRWFVRWGPGSYTDSAILYLAVVAGGGCCWIGLNLRNK